MAKNLNMENIGPSITLEEKRAVAVIAGLLCFGKIIL
jgi:hypothetical protein